MNAHVAPDTCVFYCRHVSCQVDQVPPNRTYPCSHIFLDGEALIRSTGGFSYAYHQRGKAMRGSCLGRVNEDSLESQFVGRAISVWDSFATTVAVFGPCDGQGHAMASVGRTRGYPGHELRSMSVIR